MKALENVKILDLSQKLTASLATMYLGAFGAEVIKIEKPGGGDRARTWEPMKGDDSIYFNYLNSGKKSVSLDITSEQGKEIFKKLAALSDVVVADTKPGYMESLGLGYEDLKAVKEDLIYACYSYFGHVGPNKDKAGSSLAAQAKGVAMDMTGVIGDYPVQAAPSIGEHYAGAYLASAIVMALQDKQNRGIGQMVDISLQDSLYSCIEAAPAAYSTIGEIHERKGNFDPSCAPYDTFETSDGYVAVGVATQAQWEGFCRAMEMDDLLEDPRFSDNEKRRTDYLNILRPVLADRLIHRGKIEVENNCRKIGVPCCAVLTIPEITDNENTIENNYMTVYQSDRFGTLKYPTIPFTLSETPCSPFSDAPEEGRDTEEILQRIKTV